MSHGFAAEALRRALAREDVGGKDMGIAHMEELPQEIGCEFWDLRDFEDEEVEVGESTKRTLEWDNASTRVIETF